MSIQSDKWIIHMVQQHNIIAPFSDRLINKNHQGQKIISYGTSSYGYDLRCGYQFEIFEDCRDQDYVDPKSILTSLRTIKHEGNYCILPPNSCVLTYTLERIKMPRSTLGICIGKSTYARCGIIANVTPIEPEWEGHITIELSNTSKVPVKVYAGEGIIQLLYYTGDAVCTTSYADRKGKYQNQKDKVIHAKV